MIRTKNTPDTTGIGIFLIRGRSRIVEASMEWMTNPVGLVSVTSVISIRLVSLFNFVSAMARTWFID